MICGKFLLPTSHMNYIGVKRYFTRLKIGNWLSLIGMCGSCTCCRCGGIRCRVIGVNSIITRVMRVFSNALSHMVISLRVTISTEPVRLLGKMSVYFSTLASYFWIFFFGLCRVCVILKRNELVDSLYPSSWCANPCGKYSLATLELGFYLWSHITPPCCEIIFLS